MPGFKIAMAAPESCCIRIASRALGIAQAWFDETAKYAEKRKHFERAISPCEAIQWMIADIAAGI